VKILIACEYSGIVRDAFINKGHEAMSCDLLPSESDRGPHNQGNVIDILNDGWDLMVGHPPCDYISYAATHVWNDPGRVFKRLKALEFFAKLWEAPIDKICLENPRSCASPVIAKYNQEIQPYYWGDKSVKTTWLWLKNLPKLQWKRQNDLFGPQTSSGIPEAQYFKSGRKKDCTDILGEGGYSKDRAKRRAKFWPGIADAMAEQWG